MKTKETIVAPTFIQTFGLEKHLAMPHADVSEAHRVEFAEAMETKYKKLREETCPDY